MKEISTQILDKKLASIYLVHGSEGYLRDQVYRSLQQRAAADGFGDWNWNVFQGHKELTVAEVMTSLATVGWGSGTKIVVVKGGEQLPAAFWDELVEKIGNYDGGNCLALFFTKIDGRLKGIKKLKAMAKEVACESYQGQQVNRFIEDYLQLQGVTIAPDALALFQQRVGSGLQFIQSELDKLLILTEAGGQITKKQVTELTSIVPGQVEKGAIFQMVEAMSAKDAPQAVAILHQLIDSGEAPMKILPLIDRQLRLLLASKTKGRATTRDVANLMGEKTDYPLKKVERYVSKFSVDELLERFSDVVQVDREMKLGADGEQSLEHLIRKVCG